MMADPMGDLFRAEMHTLVKEVHRWSQEAVKAADGVSGALVYEYPVVTVRHPAGWGELTRAVQLSGYPLFCSYRMHQNTRHAGRHPAGTFVGGLIWGEIGNPFTIEAQVFATRGFEPVLRRRAHIDDFTPELLDTLVEQLETIWPSGL